MASMVYVLCRSFLSFNGFLKATSIYTSYFRHHLVGSISCTLILKGIITIVTDSNYSEITMVYHVNHYIVKYSSQ